MAVYMNADISYLAGDLEIACNAKTAVFNAECTALDSTGLCSTGWTALEAGLATAMFDITGMADMAALGFDATTWSQFATKDVVHSMSIGSADGSPTYFMRGMSTSYTPIDGQVGDLAGMRLAGRTSTGKMVRGVRAHPTSVARSATGNGAGYQLGALSAAQSMFAALNVLDRTGTASMTLKVQSDDNSGFTTPTDRISSFTAAAARDYQWGSVAGAVTDTYWRVVYTITGSGTITFGASLGIAAT